MTSTAAIMVSACAAIEMEMCRATNSAEVSAWLRMTDEMQGIDRSTGCCLEFFYLKRTGIGSHTRKKGKNIRVESQKTTGEVFGSISKPPRGFTQNGSEMGISIGGHGRKAKTNEWQEEIWQGGSRYCSETQTYICDGVGRWEQYWLLCGGRMGQDRWLEDAVQARDLNRARRPGSAFEEKKPEPEPN
ncbi:hypothetical protein B0H13DRAFT_1919080 [Mycena leptocephala]|nr:hypothetical protein B0H13DRAFT_1919080 [Mycena leptocephala]